MKARDLKPGDTVDGWIVAEAELGGFMGRWCEDYGSADEIVLLTLERGQGTMDMVITTNPPQYQRKHETRRTWFPADEEVSL